jgi:hypothetical protein
VHHHAENDLYQVYQESHVFAAVLESNALDSVWCVLADRVPSDKRYLVRNAQRVIEAIEALVRIHTAQEEDIYDAVVAR